MGSRNPNPSIPLMPPRPLTLTLLLALILPALSSESPSPSPSPAHSLSHLPPKYLMSDPTGSRRSPRGRSLHYPPPRPACPAGHLDCHFPHRHGSGVAPPGHDRKLNFGQLMGIALAGIAVTLQVALGAFLVYKRLQLRQAERRGRGRLVASASTSSSF